MLADQRVGTPLSIDLRCQIGALLLQHSRRQTAKMLGISKRTVDKYAGMVELARQENRDGSNHRPRQ